MLKKSKRDIPSNVFLRQQVGEFSMGDRGQYSTIGTTKNNVFSEKIEFSIWYEIHKYRGKTKPNFTYDIHN